MSVEKWYLTFESPVRGVYVWTLKRCDIFPGPSWYKDEIQAYPNGVFPSATWASVTIHPMLRWKKMNSITCHMNPYVFMPCARASSLKIPARFSKMECVNLSQLATSQVGRYAQWKKHISLVRGNGEVGVFLSFNCKDSRTPSFCSHFPPNPVYALWLYCILYACKHYARRFLKRIHPNIYIQQLNILWQ